MTCSPHGSVLSHDTPCSFESSNFPARSSVPFFLLGRSRAGFNIHGTSRDGVHQSRDSTGLFSRDPANRGTPQYHSIPDRLPLNFFIVRVLYSAYSTRINLFYISLTKKKLTVAAMPHRTVPICTEQYQHKAAGTGTYLRSHIISHINSTRRRFDFTWYLVAFHTTRPTTIVPGKEERKRTKRISCANTPTIEPTNE